MKLQLKPTGWLPFLPVVVPFVLLMMVGATLIDSRPAGDGLLVHAAVGLATGASWWAWASRRARRRLRQDDSPT